MSTRHGWPSLPSTDGRLESAYCQRAAARKELWTYESTLRQHPIHGSSMTRPRLFLLFTVALSVGTAKSPAAEMRIWTDASGDLQVKARFVTFQGDKVWLHRSDGRTFGISMSGLSRADQEYVHRQIELGRADKRRTVNPPGRIPYAPGRKLSVLANKAVDESSGLACSRTTSTGLFVSRASTSTARISTWPRSASGGATMRRTGRA